MTKSRNKNIYSIANTEDFFQTFTSHLFSKNVGYNDLVILPSRRACRKLERYFYKNSKDNLRVIPNLTTFSDLIENPHLLLNFCPNLDITPVRQINKYELYFLVCDLLKSENIDLSFASDFISFINKFYTFANTAEEVKGSSTYNLLKKFENKLNAAELVLPPVARRIFFERISYAFSDYNNSIHIVIPIEYIPANRELVLSLAANSNVHLYLQGLDYTLPRELWDDLEQSHPQWSFKKLLESLAVDKEDVVSLGKSNTVDPSSIIMLPNNKLDLWGSFPEVVRDITLLTCEDRYQEINIISLIIREAIELGYKSIAVISENQFFNNSLKQKLLYWSIIPNDTNEDLLKNSASANLFLVLLDLIKEFSAINVLSVLKHSCSKLKDLNWHELEVNHFRKPEVTFDKLSDIVELKDFLEHLREVQSSSAYELLPKLIEFMTLYMNLELSFLEFIEKISLVFAGNRFSKAEILNIIYRLTSIEKIPQEDHGFDDVTITSFLEARLQSFDLVIVPQLNHPMPQQQSSKFLLEREFASKIDFPLEDATSAYFNYDMSLCLVKKCFLTRANRVDGKEQLPALIYEKIDTYKKLFKQDIAGLSKYSEWLQKLKHFDINPISKPMPKPNFTPDSISVSAIEKLMENPYGYYAKYILGVKRIEPIDGSLSSREFGIALHDAIKKTDFDISITKEKFISIFKDNFDIALDAFAKSVIKKSFWDDRVLKLADWIYEYEMSCSNDIKEVLKEKRISAEFNKIKVFAIPDRIENLNTEYKVVDYKTGELPTLKDIASGRAPQLAIEGLILSQILKLDTINYEYHQLKGKKDGVEIKRIQVDLERCKQGLIELVDKFFYNKSEFFSVTDVSDIKKTRDYIHLSRIQEWFD